MVEEDQAVSSEVYCLTTLFVMRGRRKDNCSFISALSSEVVTAAWNLKEVFNGVSTRRIS